jgi:geranylgeranyl diphosphate synthase, type I
LITRQNDGRTTVATPDSLAGGDLDAIIDPMIAETLSYLDVSPSLLGGMVRYHLGWVDESLQPLRPGANDRGKRLRPALAILACEAAGGRAETAVPLATAIELLHNFTLIHDDIQDGSPTRRHRPTVWSLWGQGQAINAGDALFTVSQLALFNLTAQGVSPTVVLRLAEAFNRTTVEIVTGQTLDLSFEGRHDVRPHDYLDMIAGKTAAIVRFAAWGGALLAGPSDQTADRFGEFGLALGLGFQVRDDLLGIWGASATTGKAAADDIRRRKQSLPILILRERATVEVRAELDALYDREEIDPAGVQRVLQFLADYDVRAEIEAEVRAYHDRARDALVAATEERPSPARDRLFLLVENLSSRQG